MMKAFLYTSLFVPILLAVGISLVSRWSFFETLGIDPAPTPDKLAGLRRSNSPNDYLMSPRGLSVPEPDEVSPVFPVSISRLRAAWFAMISEVPRTKLISRESSNEFQFEQRTPLFKFPDRILVRFIELPEGRSTLAIYSKSLYGHSDLGTNKRRVQDWVQFLRDYLPATVDSRDYPRALTTDNIA